MPGSRLSPSSTRPSAPAASSGARAASAGVRLPEAVARGDARARADQALCRSALEALPPAVGAAAAPSTASRRLLARRAASTLTDVVIDDDRHAGVQPAGLRHRAHSSRRARRMTYGEIAERLGDKMAGARGRHGRSGENPGADDHALPSRAGGGRQDRWLLRDRRSGHQIAPTHHRRRPARRPDFVRAFTVAGGGPRGLAERSRRRPRLMLMPFT